MRAISSTNVVQQLGQNLDQAESRQPSAKELQVREAFQDFVAGTFYKQMLKSLRKAHGRPAYFHGGAAEEIFQGQMDQQVAENLARDHGSTIADPLFAIFNHRLRSQMKPAASPETRFSGKTGFSHGIGRK